MTSHEVHELAERLDVIANLLTTLAVAQEERPSIASRIVVLHHAGLRPVEIARIIRKSTEHVTGVISRTKKAAKKKKRRIASA